jgi:hypothetical protein
MGMLITARGKDPMQEGEEGRLRRGIAFVVWSALAVALLAPASAGATALASPPTLDFGSVPVGTTSAPQTVTLTQLCTLFDSTVSPLCLTSGTDIFTLAPSASGDFAESNNAGSPCGSSLDPFATPSVSCALDVKFTPTATGNRTGTLDTGTTLVPPGPGPTVALAGVGTTPGPGSGGGGDPTVTGTPSSPPGTGGATTAPKKKCKKTKKRSAQAAKKKKCKKKKRK